VSNPQQKQPSGEIFKPGVLLRMSAVIVISWDLEGGRSVILLPTTMHIVFEDYARA
jgi:hypothetical protein